MLHQLRIEGSGAFLLKKCRMGEANGPEVNERPVDVQSRP